MSTTMRSLAAAALALGTLALLGAAPARQQPGKAIFTGKGNCSTCHGPEGKGTPLAPDLTDKTWIHIDGSVEQIKALVKTGVPQPKSHPAPMPPMGGAKLKDAEIQAVAEYVHSLSS